MFSLRCARGHQTRDHWEHKKFLLSLLQLVIVAFSFSQSSLAWRCALFDIDDQHYGQMLSSREVIFCSLIDCQPTCVHQEHFFYFTSWSTDLTTNRSPSKVPSIVDAFSLVTNPSLYEFCLSMSTYWRRIGFMAHKVFLSWSDIIPGNVFSSDALEINVCFFRILVSLERFLSVISTFWVTHLPQKFTSAFDAAGGWEWSGRSSCRRDPFAQGKHMLGWWLLELRFLLFLNLATWMSDAGIVFVSSASHYQQILQSKLPPTKWENTPSRIQRKNFRHQINRLVSACLCLFKKIAR